MSTILHLALLAAAALPLFSAAAVAASLPRTAPLPVLISARQCPAGTDWKSAGYVGSGKWRNAHCARNGGRH